MQEISTFLHSTTEVLEELLPVQIIIKASPFEAFDVTKAIGKEGIYFDDMPKA